MNLVLCEHANEVPNECRCEPDCFCKQATCRTSEKPYEFVTKDDCAAIIAQFQQGKRSLYSVSVLIHKLLKERDAALEVAVAELQDRQPVGYDEAKAEIEKEARRLLSPSGAKREKEGGV